MKATTQPALFSGQQRVADQLSKMSRVGHVFNVRSACGGGRTTLLRHLHRRMGGAFLDTKQFVDHTIDRHPIALEDGLYKMIYDALRKHEWVVVDDFHVATQAMSRCYSYPRSGYLESPLKALTNFVIEQNKKLILGSTGRLPPSLHARSFDFAIESLSADDYRFLCRKFLNDQSFDIDFAKLYRFAPSLNAHQLRATCQWCRRNGQLKIDQLIDYLRSQQLTSNVDLDEVDTVKFEDLKGVDHIVQSLETNVILPLEHDELACQIGLKPKRGILWAGPPGTANTTVGRALAHRLKGKFFLVDGTFISGSSSFYEAVDRVFQAAQVNSPSVIFIDDSDVIFDDGQEHGLYRYLLTKLDGLESATAGRVCVMMTAMDIGKLPAALVRSGRVELWLEMKLPDETARHEILLRQLQGLPCPFDKVDLERLVEATHEMTGADLKRVVEDSKALYAFDYVNEVNLQSATDYLLTAIDRLHTGKETYANAVERSKTAKSSSAISLSLSPV